MITHISSVNDVIVFFQELFDEGVNFHPDDDFAEYINTDTQLPTYSVEEAVLRNKLMIQSFDICFESNVDIYELSMEVFNYK